MTKSKDLDALMENDGFSFFGYVTNERDDSGRRVEIDDELLLVKLEGNNIGYQLVVDPDDSEQSKVYVRTEQMDDVTYLLS
jgi:hypothetical protein